MMGRTRVVQGLMVVLAAGCAVGLAGCPGPDDPVLLASFTAAPVAGTTPLWVQFTDGSQLAGAEGAAYLWDFGDETSSAEASPLHIYASAGTYSVSLTVTTPFDTDTITRTDYVTVAPADNAAAVPFVDSNLGDAIAHAINRPAGTVTIAEARVKNTIELVNHALTDLRGLEYFTGLRQLRISDCDADGPLDLTPISALTNLIQLQLDGDGIIDLSPLASLPNLAVLYLHGNLVEDLTPLTNLKSLSSLHLDNNLIGDIAPLAGLTNLQVLNLSGNAISSIAPLDSLTGLQILYLDNNLIQDLTPVTDLTNLAMLNLGLNDITDPGPLAGLTNLHSLNLNDNNITNIVALGGLDSLAYLYLSNNPLNTSTACTIIATLTAGGTTVSSDLACSR